MKTKERIRHTAVRIYNERGFSQVSLRDISTDMSISPGNLTYHFRNREELLQAIYQQMFEEMQTFYQREYADPLEVLAAIPRQSREFIYRYRFFFADLRTIVQEFPWVQERHRKVVAMRLQGGQEIVKVLGERGDLLPEPFHGAYGHLVHLIWMVATFWYNQEPVLPEDHPAREPQYLQETLSQMLNPHFSPGGRERWQAIQNHINQE